MEKRTLEAWGNAWENNWTGWHLDHANTNLTENIEFLTDNKPNRRILVPFCGKTLDMIWLVKQGHSVIGVEVVQKAIQDFFNENKISFEKKDVGENSHCYMAFDGKLKLFDCDYFKFNSSLAGGKVDGIWDCNALGALPSDYWAQYLQTSLELLDSHGRMLLQAFLYNQDEYEGPPFSVPKEELSHVLGNSYEVQLLNRKPAEDARACGRFGQACTWLDRTLLAISKV